MGSEIAIRRASPDEAAELSALAKAAKSHWGYTREVVEGWRDALTLTPQQIDSNPTYVAEANGELFGFYQISIEGSRAELEHMWVDPRAMRRGIGRGLIRHAMLEAADLGAVVLYIDADPNAASFYLKCGARPMGETPAPIASEPERVRHLLSLDLRS